MAKTKSEISKVILKNMLIGGAFVIACGSPFFAGKALPMLLKEARFKINQKKQKEQREKYYNSFYYLRKKGLLNMEYRGKQLHISLSNDGKLLAKKYSIDDLKIEKSKKWDKKWRILIFDIEEKYKIRRDALRGKLKELKLYQLQKSVWVCPYHFRNEIDVLKNFFGFTHGEMTTLIASEIEDEEKLITFFNLKKIK